MCFCYHCPTPPLSLPFFILFFQLCDASRRVSSAMPSFHATRRPCARSDGEREEREELVRELLDSVMYRASRLCSIGLRRDQVFSRSEIDFPQYPRIYDYVRTLKCCYKSHCCESRELQLERSYIRECKEMTRDLTFPFISSKLYFRKKFI